MDSTIGMDEQKKKLLICYPGRRGFIFEAHKLQQQISAAFNLAVEIEEHAEECLSLLLEGTLIYSEDSADSAAIAHAEILRAVSKHEQPLTTSGEAAAEISAPSANEDPDHRRWLNSVCSGE